MQNTANEVCSLLIDKLNALVLCYFVHIYRFFFFLGGGGGGTGEGSFPRVVCYTDMLRFVIQSISRILTKLPTK